MKGWLRADHSDIHMCSPSHTQEVHRPSCCIPAVRLQSKYASAAGAFSECVRAFTLCCICAVVHSPLWCTRRERERERDDLIGLILRRTTGPMCGIVQGDYAECKQNKLLLWKSDMECFSLGKWSLWTAHGGKVLEDTLFVVSPHAPCHFQFGRASFDFTTNWLNGVLFNDVIKSKSNYRV